MEWLSDHAAAAWAILAVLLVVAELVSLDLIFVMLAGSYTPLCLVVLDGWVATAMLVTAWTGAALGTYLAWHDSKRSAILRSALYIVLGWASLAAMPQFLDRLSAAELVLIGLGGLLFTVGAGTLATRWPDPFPRVFGYHEVWHAFTLAAGACHFALIFLVLN